MKLSFSMHSLEILSLTCCSSDLDLPKKLVHFKFQLSRKKKVPKCLDEEGDFVLACLRTCEVKATCKNYAQLYHTRRRSGWRCRPGCLKSQVTLDKPY